MKLVSTALKSINMDPIALLGGLFGGAQLLGLGSNIYQTERANAWNERQLQAQLEENEKNRKYNSAEAAIARNFQANFAREMFDKSNAYNSPQNQVAMMRAAGLNPALAYSQGSFSSASMPSVSAPSASSSGSITPTQYNKFDALGSALAIQRQASEIANIDADTRQKNAQGSILESDASFRDAFNQGNLDLQHLQIEMGKTDMRLDEAQISKFQSEVEYLNLHVESFDKQVQLLDTQIASGQLDLESKRIDNFYKSKQYEAILDKFAADTSLSRAQAHSILSKLPYEIKKFGADTALSNALSTAAEYQGIKASWESRKLQLDLLDAEDYYNFMQYKGGDLARTLNGMTQYLGRFIDNLIPSVVK